MMWGLGVFKGLGAWDSALKALGLRVWGFWGSRLEVKKIGTYTNPQEQALP